MNNLPDSYPYLEPCLGCFENGLQALSEHPGSRVFFANGDFTLERLVLALSKLVNGADLLISCYRLEEGTVAYILKLKAEGVLGEVIVFCTHDASSYSAHPEDGFRVIPCGMNTFVIQARDEHRSVTISGLFMQGMASRGLELFVMHNDAEQQALIRKTLFTHFRKQIYAYVKR